MNMRTFHWILLITVSLFLGSVVIAQQPATSAAKPATDKPAKPTPAAKPAAAKAAAVSTARPLPEYTFKQLMDSMVDPMADVIWDAVSTSLTDKGRVEKRPSTPEEWQKILDAAVMLSESANLLTIPGRTRAYGGPIPAKARADFAREARALQLLADKAVKAAQEKNADAIYEIGEPIDTQCDNCHVKYYDLTQFEKKK
jgi:hypothetical protein